MDITQSGHAARKTALLGTCHQLRAEAAESYYTKVIFFVPLLADPTRWSLKMRDEHARLVTYVRHDQDQLSARPSLYHSLEFLIMRCDEEDDRVDWAGVLRMYWYIEDECDDEDEGVGWARLWELPEEAKELME